MVNDDAAVSVQPANELEANTSAKSLLEERPRTQVRARRTDFDTHNIGLMYLLGHTVSKTT